MIGKTLIQFLKFALGLRPASTQTTKQEIELIKKYAIDKKYVVEIGVFEAVNTVSIAQVLNKNAIFFAVDPFFKGKLGICYYKYTAKLNLLRNRLLDNVTFIEAFSKDAAKNIESIIDFILVDGDHSYEGVQKDWELYSAKMIFGGFILLHDTSVPNFDPDRAHLGSVKFFNDVIKKDNRFKIIETIDSLNVLVRL